MWNGARQGKVPMYQGTGLNFSLSLKILLSASTMYIVNPHSIDSWYIYKTINNIKYVHACMRGWVGEITFECIGLIKYCFNSVTAVSFP